MKPVLHDVLKTPLLVVALSGRALACAAHKLGIPVYVLDVFNDVDTQACAVASQRVATLNSEFDPDALLAAVQNLCPPDTPLVYGAGFESNPILLAKLAEGRELLGNTPALIEQLKDPAYFFPLLDKLHLPHPETQLTPPEACEEWLVKQIGGAGGQHVQVLQECSSNADAQAWYYQRRLAGNPHSMIFLANGEQAYIIGYNEQWHDEAFSFTTQTPFLYKGAMSVDDMPLQENLQQAVNAIVAATGLRGLCSMDMMLNASGFHILEINPRPTASFELHQLQGNLFYGHLQACHGILPDHLPHPKHQRAHSILYAGADVKIPDNLHWPAWTADHPAPHQQIRAGDPICTIFAQGGRSLQKVQQREQRLLFMLKDTEKQGRFV